MEAVTQHIPMERQPLTRDMGKRIHAIPALLSLPLGLLGIFWLWRAVFVTNAWLQERISGAVIDLSEVELADLAMSKFWFYTDQVAAAVGGLVLVGSALLVAARKPWSLRFVRVGAIAYLCIVVVHTLGIAEATDRTQQAAKALGAMPDNSDMFWHRWYLLWQHWFWAVFAMCLVMLSRTNLTRALFGQDVTEEQLPVGDRFFENLRTHGVDPEYRKSNYSSHFLHLLILVIIPWLIMMWGCIEPYRLPLGSGKPAVLQVVKVTKVVPEKKKYILNPKSPIIFEQPDIDDSEILKQVEKATELTYEANPDAEAGALGEGGGDEGGWPDGWPGGELRFIRMEYNTSQWDDGMSASSGADVNLLRKIKGLVPFPVRQHGEAHRIPLLKRYPDAQAPPFIYMTGSGGIRLSSTERKVLREYAIDMGGLIFADAGSSRWARSFEHTIKQVFPDKRLVEIADDDPIFRLPYVFANGAPPLWHHGGYRAKGIKHKGRWIVFYHPGDLNDAWKTGHSGAKPKVAESSMHMAVNVIYYAATQYLRQNRSKRR